MPANNAAIFPLGSIRPSALVLEYFDHITDIIYILCATLFSIENKADSKSVAVVDAVMMSAVENLQAVVLMSCNPNILHSKGGFSDCVQEQPRPRRTAERCLRTRSTLQLRLDEARHITFLTSTA